MSPGTGAPARSCGSPPHARRPRLVGQPRGPRRARRRAARASPSRPTAARRHLARREHRHRGRGHAERRAADPRPGRPSGSLHPAAEQLTATPVAQLLARHRAGRPGERGMAAGGDETRAGGTVRVAPAAAGGGFGPEQVIADRRHRRVPRRLRAALRRDAAVRVELPGPHARRRAAAGRSFGARRARPARGLPADRRRRERRRHRPGTASTATPSASRRRFGAR